MLESSSSLENAIDAFASPQTHVGTLRPHFNQRLDTIQWIIVAASFAWTAISPLVWKGPAMIMLIVLALPFVVLRGARQYGA
jgi:hypothetical protein